MKKKKKTIKQVVVEVMNMSSCAKLVMKCLVGTRVRNDRISVFGLATIATETSQRTEFSVHQSSNNERQRKKSTMVRNKQKIDLMRRAMTHHTLLNRHGVQQSKSIREHSLPPVQRLLLRHPREQSRFA